MRRVFLAAPLAVLFLALEGAGASSALNTAGQLDRTFGDRGKVVADLGTDDFLAAIAVQRDGKIIAGGLGQDGSGKRHWHVARYDRRGALDRGFASGGFAADPFAADPSGAEAFDVAVQPDSKIVAIGDSASDRSFDLTLVRYNADGSLDGGFGSGGVVRTDFAPATSHALDFGSAVKIAADGKIVAAGSTGRVIPGSPRDYDFAVARFNADGSLDPTFGSGGRVVTDFGGQGDSGTSLALAANGRIVVAGFTAPGGTLANERIAIARYRSDGSLDPTFDGDGMLVGAQGFVAHVLIQDEGRLVVAGATGAADARTFGLWRYGSDGQLDGSFGSRGMASVAGASSLTAVTEDTHGRLVAAGGTGAHPDFTLARFTAIGKPDRSFGAGGAVETDFGGADVAGSVAVAPDGKIVAGGSSYAGPSNDNWALARYLPTYCIVPPVRGDSTRSAKRKIVRAHCTLGRVRSIASAKVERNHVVAQRPRAGKRIPEDARVSLVVSGGSRAGRR